MQRKLTRRLLLTAAVVGTVLLAVLPAGATAASDNVYSVTNLVSDQSGQAANTDSNLVNAWGLTSTAGSPWWVSDNQTNVATVYRANGTTARVPVAVSSAPTGAVSNSSSNFVITGTATPATYIFSTENGQILALAPGVSGNTAMQEVATPDAANTGRASAADPLHPTDLHHGR